jgi:hypothetical protein
MDLPSVNFVRPIRKQIYYLFEEALYGNEAASAAKDCHKHCCWGMVELVAQLLLAFSHSYLQQSDLILSF